MQNVLRRMWPLLAFIFIAMLVNSGYVTPAYAQQTPDPVYSVSIVDWRTSADGQNIEIEFKVVNTGGPATEAVRTDIVVLEGNDQSRVLASADIRPLGTTAPDNEQAMVMSAPLSSFEPGSRQVFRVQFVTPLDMEGRFNNSTTVSIDVPEASNTGTDTGTSGTGDTDTGTSEEPIDVPETVQDVVVPANPVTIPLIDLTVDLADRNQVLVAIAFGATLILLILLVTRIIRAMLMRYPSFGNWHPPYATVAQLDPNSTAGIRQAWQLHANNNVIDTPGTPGATHAVKQVIGNDGDYLSGWKVLAMRLNLYDVYGRVARTQTLASSRDVSQLNALIRRRHKMKPERVQKRVRPIAKRMTKAFWKRISSRSAMLPVALDIRLTGKHGEVNILFELYQFNNGGWQLLDHWSPEIMRVSKRLYDSYTYTIFGLSGGETMREYRQRLQTDMEHRLIELLGALPQQIENTSAKQAYPDAPTGTVLTTSDNPEHAEPEDNKPRRMRRGARRGRNNNRNGTSDVASGTPVTNQGADNYLDADEHDMNTVKSGSYFDQLDQEDKD